MASECIIVNRVSSAEQKDGYSLDAQSRMGTAYAEEHKYKVVKEFTFQESASKSTEQKLFEEVLLFVSSYSVKNKSPLHVIVEKKDRWGRLHSRKEILQTLVLARRVVLHYYREKQILDHTCSPEDVFMDDVVTSMNKYVALNIGREARKGMIEKAKQGWLPHKPPIGYLNNPDKSDPLQIIINQKERDLVYRVFELRAVANLSYEAISEKVKQECLVPIHRALFRSSMVEKVLKNPFYSGEFVFSGERYTGKQELFIPSAMIKRVKASFGHPGQSINPNSGSRFGEMLRCATPECGCKISYQKKLKPSGRVYHLYSCSNGKSVHKSLKGMYQTEPQILDGFEPALDQITVSENMAKDIADALNANHLKLKSRIKREQESYLHALKVMNEKEDELYTDMKRSLIDEDMYHRQIENVRKERERLSQLLNDLNSTVLDTYLVTAKEILELAKDAKTLWKSRSVEEKVDFLKKILWNSKMTGTTIEYELKKPFSVLAKMNEREEWGG